MKSKFKVRQMFLLLLFLPGFTLAKVTSYSKNIPRNFYIQPKDSGGPDQYGYRWIDNNGSGGPLYNWIEISDIGVEVTGLADDNVVGPFPIGFEFPYYWYKVDHFWVCSNGVISFSSSDLWTPHNGGSIIPQPSLPNDVVAPLGGDLNPGAGGHVYYYSNGIDTLIVEFKDVPEWHYGTGSYGAHTFELILCKTDSSITFQYGPQNGQFNYGPGMPPACAIGIENVTGLIGLQYLQDNNPSNHLYHEGLAIKFVPPETTTYQVTDLAITSLLDPENRGGFILINQPIQLWATIHNAGNQDIPNYRVYIEVKNAQTGMVEMRDTVYGGLIRAQEYKDISFGVGAPDEIGVYSITAWVDAPGDMASFNDTITVEWRVVAGHTRLSYLNDTTQVGLTHWYGAGGGFGARFVPPVYPCTIETVFVGLGVGQNSTPGNAALFIFDDDGENGLPGTVLAADTVFVNEQVAWYALIPNSPITITEGAFYVGMIQLEDDGPDFALDQTPPFSRNIYEFTGSWAPYRDKEFTDPWIRVAVTLPQNYRGDSILDVHAGNALLSVANNGALGFWSSDQGAGSGFIYPASGSNTLFYGSFALGNSENYVVDAWYDPGSDDRDFGPVTGMMYMRVPLRLSNEATWTEFNDSGHPQSRGIDIESFAYAYTNLNYDDFVILLYRISSDNPVSGLYAALFMDFDIDQYLLNQARVDNATGSVYEWSSATNRYVGIVPLTPQIANLSVIKNPQFVYPYQGCPDSIQWKFMSGIYSFSEGLVDTDWSIVASVGPFDLVPGEEKIVAFAVVGGLGETDFLNNAMNAKEIFNDSTLVGIFEREDTRNIAVFKPFRVIQNPVKNRLRLAVNLKTAGVYKLEIYDITGRKIIEKDFGKINSGKREIGININRLNSGLYFIQISGKNTRTTLKFIKLK